MSPELLARLATVPIARGRAARSRTDRREQRHKKKSHRVRDRRRPVAAQGSVAKRKLPESKVACRRSPPAPRPSSRSPAGCCSCRRSTLEADDAADARHRLVERHRARRAALARKPKIEVDVRPSDLYRLTKAVPGSRHRRASCSRLNRLAGLHGRHLPSIRRETLVRARATTCLPFESSSTAASARSTAFLRPVAASSSPSRRTVLDARGRLFAVDNVSPGRARRKTTFPTVQATDHSRRLRVRRHRVGTPAPSTTDGSTDPTTRPARRRAPRPLQERPPDGHEEQHSQQERAQAEHLHRDRRRRSSSRSPVIQGPKLLKRNSGRRPRRARPRRRPARTEVSRRRPRQLLLLPSSRGPRWSSKSVVRAPAPRRRRRRLIVSPWQLAEGRRRLSSDVQPASKTRIRSSSRSDAAAHARPGPAVRQSCELGRPRRRHRRRLRRAHVDAGGRGQRSLRRSCLRATIATIEVNGNEVRLALDQRFPPSDQALQAHGAEARVGAKSSWPPAARSARTSKIVLTHGQAADARQLGHRQRASS